jgi:hypothetical protein
MYSRVKEVCGLSGQQRFVLQKTTTKKAGMLISCIVLIYDNACPHTVPRIPALLDHFNSGLYDHPSYSTDLAASDYRLFTQLKNWMESQRFSNTEQLMEGIKL